MALEELLFCNGFVLSLIRNTTECTDCYLNQAHRAQKVNRNHLLDCLFHHGEL